MPKSNILYQSNEYVSGKHLRSNEWVSYSGKLTIYDRKTFPVILKLKSEIFDSIISEIMEDKKEFKGDTISEVYGKMAKWYLKRGVVFQY